MNNVYFDKIQFPIAYLQYSLTSKYLQTEETKYKKKKELKYRHMLLFETQYNQ